MAIKLSYTNSQGFLCPEAYVRIANYDGDKDSIRLGIWIYKDKDARDNDFGTIDQFRLELNITDGATFLQMYDALKDLPQFTGAIDC